eukprot:TRINITY_DN8499_c0_g1_i1.p1 TRINITY_DN8499_c0_g1~~TRINITY_DN8499_c0_g1_i1.p1  ORF type:complete len:401 (+),score=21.61 TRINITY_DN8499_c0_g1_i1:54-1256(+)
MYGCENLFMECKTVSINTKYPYKLLCERFTPINILSNPVRAYVLAVYKKSIDIIFLDLQNYDNYIDAIMLYVNQQNLDKTLFIYPNKKLFNKFDIVTIRWDGNCRECDEIMLNNLYLCMIDIPKSSKKLSFLGSDNIDIEDIKLDILHLLGAIPSMPVDIRNNILRIYSNSLDIKLFNLVGYSLGIFNKYNIIINENKFEWKENKIISNKIYSPKYRTSLENIEIYDSALDESGYIYLLIDFPDVFIFGMFTGKKDISQYIEDTYNTNVKILMILYIHSVKYIHSKILNTLRESGRYSNELDRVFGLAANILGIILSVLSSLNMYIPEYLLSDLITYDINNRISEGSCIRCTNGKILNITSIPIYDNTLIYINDKKYEVCNLYTYCKMCHCYMPTYKLVE